MKRFFGIESNKYVFEWYDLTTAVTILNVAFVLMGFWWAPILGLCNCIACIILNIRYHAHINGYITQLALIILNSYFLTL